MEMSSGTRTRPVLSVALTIQRAADATEREQALLDSLQFGGFLSTNRNNAQLDCACRGMYVLRSDASTS